MQIVKTGICVVKIYPFDVLSDFFISYLAMNMEVAILAAINMIPNAVIVSTFDFITGVCIICKKTMPAK
jgi:hypothetical protein